MSPTPLDIRPVGTADHAAWLPLWQGYQRFYKTEIAAETSAVTWQRFLDPAEPMHAALAWQDGKALGMVHWIFHRSCWTTGDYCYLQDLFVAEGLRGGGIGRQLIEHVYAAARAAGASRVHWLTHEGNEVAMRLYDDIADRPGFVQYRKIL
jgi:GNAT superfamily N-acetyltransferase